jgi:DNA recombination protein RmuC
MDYASILTGALCLVFGGAAAAFITLFVNRNKFLQAESVLRSERDIALAAVRERENNIATLNSNLADLGAKHEELIGANARLSEEKGKLAGEQLSFESVKGQLASKEEAVTGLNDQVKHLSTINAELVSGIKAAEDAKRDAVAAMESHLKSTLEAKDASVKAMLEDRAEALRLQLTEKDRSVNELLTAKDAALDGQKKLLEEAERVLTEKFSVVSTKSLETASDQFLKLADERLKKVGELSAADLEKRQTAIIELVKPVADTLEKLQLHQAEMETRRVSAFDAIEKGIQTLSKDTDQLANALRKPTARGAWGEMNLEVILENAGLIRGEHFDVQHTTDDDDGRLRTDFVVHLPSGRDIIIDSKAPLEAFTEGMNAEDEATKRAKFAAHARLVRDHVKNLSSKKYWSRYKNSPDCVVMFLPTEGAYQAAIELDPTLLSEAHNARVYIANPMTIVNVIHLTAYVLREERLKRSIDDVQAAGSQLYERLSNLVAGISAMGKSLKVTVNHFNSAVGTLDSRVMPSARRIYDLGAGAGAAIKPVSEIEVFPRMVLSQEVHGLLEPPKGLLLDEDPILEEAE